MKAISRALTIGAGAGLLVALFASSAFAGCGDLSNLDGPFVFSDPLARAATPDVVRESALERGSGGASIVGMWSFKFISQGNTTHNPSIPDGAMIDFGYTQWHSDGTEITNSGGRSPAVENFCLGVWGKTGFDTYELNHFAFNYDASSGAMTGILEVREQVTLSPSGDSFSGTFTVDAYDTKGNHIDHVGGNIPGTRVTVDTTVP